MKEFQNLKDSIRTVPDYPVKGVQFRDITTLLQNASLFKKMIDGMTKQWADAEIDAILSIESRGFIMAGALAHNLGTAFIPLRKPQKLPYKTHSISYELEYGATDMHIHTDALDGHTNLLIIDDKRKFHNWIEGYVKWEIGILSSIGFSLDLKQCTVTGNKNNLY